MSADNGIIRVGRKGKKKFVFGDDDTKAFTVDVVEAFQDYIGIDSTFRTEVREDGNKVIPTAEMPAFHEAVRQWAIGLATPKGGTQEDPVQRPDITAAEALDFAARLREVWNELQDFFVPKSPQKPESPGSSGVELRFSVEQPEA